MDEKTEELKRHLQIMSNDDDDVYTEATPLALKNYDREDLKTFWKLVKERFETTEPKNFSDDFLLNILKIIFEKPVIEANVWKEQKGRYGLAKKYPLIHFTLQQMLNNVRLRVEEESEMSLELLRLNPFSYAKLTAFVVMCKAYGCEPSVDLFQGFFNLCQASKWLTFAKRCKKHIPNLLSKDRKCNIKGGSSRPPVKRKLAPRSSTSRATRAKTSSLKDDVPYLIVFDDDEGLPNVLELKDATVIKKLRGEYDVMKDMERAREEECKELHAKYEAAMTEFEKKLTIVALWEKISTLSTDCKKHKASLNKMMLESQKLVYFAIFYWRCRVYEQVADMKEPFDLSNVKGYCSSYKKDHTQASNDLATATFLWLDEFVADPLAPIEALLSKNPPSL
nr:hypothetical protein [Tanacetum cinerariifolium]